MFSRKAFLQDVQEASQRVSVANDAELYVVPTGNAAMEADIGGVMRLDDFRCYVRSGDSREGCFFRSVGYAVRATAFSSPVSELVAVGIILWHRRMEHLNEQSLISSETWQMEFGNVKISTCVTCLEGKHFRQPFNNELKC